LTAEKKTKQSLNLHISLTHPPPKKNTRNKTLKLYGRKVLKHLAGLLERVLAFQITWLKELFGFFTMEKTLLKNGDVFFV